MLIGREGVNFVRTSFEFGTQNCCSLNFCWNSNVFQKSSKFIIFYLLFLILRQKQD